MCDVVIAVLKRAMQPSTSLHSGETQGLYYEWPATVAILLFEEIQCHHREELKNNQNVNRVSDKS